MPCARMFYKDSKKMQPRIAFLAAMILMLFAGASFAQDEPPVPIAEGKGKTGAFSVALSDRSPLGELPVIARRLSMKPAELGDDYDLSKERFQVYVPKDADANGKYGVMVGLCFKEYGFPATAWTDVLEKKHLIWIGAVNNGDERPPGQRIGLLLDAAAAVEKTWPVDADRVYLSMNAGKGPALGTAFYYPDVFTGMLGSYAAHWFMKLKGPEHPPMIWSMDDFPRPASKELSLARSQSRFFQAERDDEGHAIPNELVKKAFATAEFRYAKFVKVPEANMGHYINYSADWFEQGVDFLDEPLTKIRAVRKPRPKPIVNPLKLPAQ